MAGVLWAFTATLGFAVYQIINRRLVQQANVYAITVIVLLVSVVVGLIFVPVLGEPGMWGRLTVAAGVWFGLSGIVHFSLGWTFLSLAQRAVGAARTSPLTTSSVIVGALLGTLFFTEPFNGTLLIGIGLTIVGVYLISRQD